MAGLLAAIVPLAGLSAAAATPNVLLVIADDMGIDASPCYDTGTEKPRMPVLEELCATGVVFDNAWATPVCSPTRATLLTGRYGLRTGVGDAATLAGGGIPLTETSLHELLDQTSPAGYRHAVIGKWHLSDRSNGGDDNPNVMGVGHYAGLIRGRHDYFDWTRVENGRSRRIREYSTTHFTDLAIDWIDRQSGPWFLWLAYTAPHAPFHLPPTGLHSRPDLPGTAADVRSRPLQYYLAMLEALDHELGRLLDSLPPAVRRETVVLFLGDNGTPRSVAQDEVGGRAKGTLYQSGIHVPLVVSGAGVSRQGRRENDLVHTVDLFSTIASLAGAEPAAESDGIAFDHLLTGSGPRVRRYAYSELFSSGRPGRNDGWTVRGRRYKLIEFESGERELYDLRADPHEQVNLLAGELSPRHERALAGLERHGRTVRGE